MTSSSAESLKQQAIQIIQQAEIFIPGSSDKDKKQWCVVETTKIVEFIDDQIPVIGIILELPPVHILEHKAVEMLVDWAWAEVNSNK